MDHSSRCLLVQTVLRDGTLTAHNMVEIRTKADFYQFETLWQAFDAPGGITVLCTGPATEVLEVMGTRKTLFRGKMGPKVDNVAIKRYGNHEKCPWSAPTTKVQKDALPIVSKVTVRIVAPKAYRQIFLPEGEEDSPASIIGLAAQNAKIPVAVLTGGRWSKQFFGNKPQTAGFLRVSAAAAEKLLKISGDHGIFFTKVQEEANNPKPSFFWFGKKPSESSESYFRRCKVLASEREQPLVLRTGGGSDLGCLRKNTDSNECRPRVVDLWGVPRNWGAEEVCSLLSTLKWESGQVLSRKRFGKHWSWRVKATPPKDSIEKGSWVYEIDDSPQWTLEILLAPPKNPSVTSERVPGPKRLFGDVTLEDFMEHSKTEKRGRGTQRRDNSDLNRSPRRERSRSPLRSKEDEKQETTEKPNEDTHIPPTELDPPSQECSSKPLNSFPIDPTEAVKHFNWTFVDWKGSGDCGFRAVADGWVKRQQRETWTQDDAKRTAAWVRAEAISHIRKHHSKFKEFVPTDCSSFEDWLKRASQSSYWISGVLLQALAERLGTPIVVFKWDEISKSWRRFCIAARFSGGWACKAKHVSPIAVVLQKQHYVALRPKDDADFPRNWLQQTASPGDSEFIIDLTGAGRKASSSNSKVSTKREIQKTTPKSGKSEIGSVCESEKKNFECPLHTPSVYSTSDTCAHALVKDATPSVHSMMPSAHTPSVHTLRQDSQVNGHGGSRPLDVPSLNVPRSVSVARDNQTIVPEEFHVLDSMASTAIGHMGPRQRSATIKPTRRLIGKQTFLPVKPAKFDRRKPTSWTCPVCQFTTSGTYGGMLASKRWHMRTRHPEVPAAVYSLQRPQPVVASPELPDAERDWSCPMCTAGLPQLASQERLLGHILLNSCQVKP